MLNLILSSLETGRAARASDKHRGWEKGIKKERSVSAGPRQKRELSHHRSYLKFKHNTPPTPPPSLSLSHNSNTPVAACMVAFSSGDRVSPTHLYSAFCVFLGIWWGLIRMLPWLEQRGKEKKQTVMVNETSCSGSLMCNVIEVEKKKRYKYKDHLFLSFSRDQTDTFISFYLRRSGFTHWLYLDYSLKLKYHQQIDVLWCTAALSVNQYI